MPTEKIADVPRPCLNRLHRPPQHMVYPSGVYRHVCPGCGKVTEFTVRRPVW